MKEDNIGILEYCDAVAKDCGFVMSDLSGNSKGRNISTLRFMLWAELSKAGIKLKDIARLFNRKSHATIVHGIIKARELEKIKDPIFLAYTDVA